MFNRSRQIEIGQLEAEAEITKRSKIKLEDVFYDLIDVVNFFENENKFLLIGGKGSGKSAFARIYEKNSQESYNKFCKIITKSEFNFEKIIQTISNQDLKEYSSAEIEKYFIEWLILTQLFDLIKEHEYIKNLKEYDKIIEFQKINRGIISVNEREIIEAIKQFSGQVNVAPLNKFIKANFDKKSVFKYQKAVFIKIIPDFKNTLKNLLIDIQKYSENENFYFTLIIDDLDHDLKNIDSHRNFLMSMIRTVKDYNISYIDLNNVFFKAVLLLRPDIVSELNSFSDSFKTIESYKSTINWYDHILYQQSEKSSHLRILVNSRLKKVLISFDGRKISDDPWYDLVDKNSDKPDKTMFKWCLDRTRYRPRDIIFLVNKFLTNMKKNEKIDYNKIYSSMNSYSIGFWKEIQNELSFYFNYNELSQIEILLKKLPSVFSYDAFIKTFPSVNLIDFEPDRVLEILFNNSVIGNFDSNRMLYFKHRETEDEPVHINYDMKFILNNGLKYYFDKS